MKHILFVCIENSNRSQMAEAFARMYGKATLKAYSAGSKPGGKINPRAIKAMKELNYDLSLHRSKSLDELPDLVFDRVITMGCDDACPHIQAKTREDWGIPDPKNLNDIEFRVIRDYIGIKVKVLMEEC